jgi:hypothetical protein
MDYLNHCRSDKNMFCERNMKKCQINFEGNRPNKFGIHVEWDRGLMDSPLGRALSTIYSS